MDLDPFGTTYAVQRQMIYSHPNLVKTHAGTVKSKHVVSLKYNTRRLFLEEAALSGGCGGDLRHRFVLVRNAKS
jgi:hypothetical protein